MHRSADHKLARKRESLINEREGVRGEREGPRQIDKQIYTHEHTHTYI